MKILVVANMYPSAKDPVYGTFVKNFFEQVDKRNSGGSTTLCTIRGRRMGKFAKLSAYISYYLRLTGRLIFGKYDLVYVHTVAFPTPALRFASLFRKLPLAFNAHGDDILPSNKFKRFLRDMSEPLLKKARMIVVPSEYFRQVILSVFPGVDSSRIVKSPSGGLNRSFFRRKKSVSGAGEPLRLGFVSRIDRGKGWNLFIDLVMRLNQSGIKCSGIIAGRGAQTESMLEYIKSCDASDIVEYIGPQSHDKLPDLYSSFDLFIFPTMNASESLGLVGLEAMAAGTPVIASDMAGPKGYVVDGVNGYLFEPGNIDRLTDSVRKYAALSADEKLRMSDNAYRTATEYESEKVADELFEHIKKAAEAAHNK